MTSSARKPFVLRPHDAEGTWASNDARYRAYAHELLVQLKSLCTEVLQRWPAEAGATISNESQHLELWKLARLRDRTSDTVRIYAAMAVEGFLNFYGVLRLGQQAFDEHFERLGVVPKLRTLLLVGESLDLPRNDPLVLMLHSVAQSRNALVHPKTREISNERRVNDRPSTKLPEVAQEAVANMESFFEQFAQAVPSMASHLARRTVA
jgi:hypothetical protein